MSDPRVTLQKAYKALQAGDAVQAETLCRDLLGTKAVFEQSQLLLGISLCEQRKFDQAKAFLLPLAENQPDKTDYQTRAGGVLRRLGEHGAAIPFLNRAAANEPSNPDRCYEALGCRTFHYKATNKAELQQGSPIPPELKSLVEAAERSIAAFPDHANLVCLAGEIFQLAKLDEKALTCFGKVLKVRPILRPAHYHWVKLQMRFAHYQDVVDYTIENSDALDELNLMERFIGNAHYELGEYAKALEHLSKFECDPSKDELVHILTSLTKSSAYLKLGKFNDCIASIEDALTAEIKDEEARKYRFGLFHNRGIANKKLGDVAAAIKDEFARLEFFNGNPITKVDAPLWQGEDLSGKRLAVWSDMNMGDDFRYLGLLQDLPTDAEITFISRPKMMAFAQAVLPNVEVAARPERRIPRAHLKGIDPIFHPWEGKADYHMPLAGIYTQLRPDLKSIRSKAKAHHLPDEIIQKTLALDCFANKDTVFVGLAGTRQTNAEKAARNDLTLEDWLPVLQMPGFTFFTFQYSATEEEIDAFRLKHRVPIHHAPIHQASGLDLLDDIMGTAALTSCMDLFVSPANICADIAGSMGVKSLRFDLVKSPENLGQDFVPWYEDQRCISIPPDKSVLDYIGDAQAWLESNRSHRCKYRLASPIVD